ncbi:MULTISPECIES: hypothetical protein [Methanobacterium]|uniref:hypothetical protein n=1 Tax=Methanobacterium TaxID=2160 RepID=UPI002412BA0E|nr:MULTISPECIES: hypothetical protein [Methanobacterium]MDG3546282.1 hypothetical protein [Methanobacterium formicicum]
MVTGFTAIVAVVILFYFGSRTLDSYYASGKSAKSEEETETTVAKYGEDGKLIEKTVTTEKIKKR